jgi:hypothetical protein
MHLCNAKKTDYYIRSPSTIANCKIQNLTILSIRKSYLLLKSSSENLIDKSITAERRKLLPIIKI